MRVNDALDQRYMTKWGMCVCVCVFVSVSAQVIAGRALTIEGQNFLPGSQPVQLNSRPDMNSSLIKPVMTIGKTARETPLADPA